MSLVSASTGSYTLTVSGSGFSGSTANPSGNPDTNFNGKVFVAKWQSIDNPNISYGGFLDGNIILDMNTTGFNRPIYLPYQQIPSGQYDLMIDLPNTTGNLTPPLRLRVNISGSIATRAVTTTGSIITSQYQDILSNAPFLNSNTPFGTSTGTPEFGYASGSVVG